jgi:hypothetical protein
LPQQQHEHRAIDQWKQAVQHGGVANEWASLAVPDLVRFLIIAGLVASSH